MKLQLAEWIRSLAPTSRHNVRRQHKRRTRRRPPQVEALEQRLLLVTTTSTYSITVVEDTAGDGVTPDDVPTPGWVLFSSEGTTTYHYSCANDIPPTTTSSSGFVANGSSATSSTTTETFSLTCPVTVVDPDGTSHVENRTIVYANVVTQESGTSLVEQPPVGEYWVPTGNDCGGSTCVLDHAVKFAYYHVPSVNGVVFHDHNGNGLRDGEDETLPGSSVCIFPGAFNADPCLEQGFYRFLFRASGGDFRSDTTAPSTVDSGGDGSYTLPAIPRIALGPALSGRPPFSLAVSPPPALAGVEVATTGDTRFNSDTTSGAALNRDG